MDINFKFEIGNKVQFKQFAYIIIDGVKFVDESYLINGIIRIRRFVETKTLGSKNNYLYDVEPLDIDTCKDGYRDQVSAPQNIIRCVHQENINLMPISSIG